MPNRQLVARRKFETFFNIYVDYSFMINEDGSGLVVKNFI